VRLLPLLLIPALAGCGVPATRSCDPVDGIEPICGVQGPEDVAIIPWTRWLLLSEMPSGADPQGHPGSLTALNLDTRKTLLLYPREGADDPRPGWADAKCPGPPGKAFSPHGIDLDGSRLLVVNHGGREAVEVFDLEAGGAEPHVTWHGCAVAPDDASLNDVAALPQSGFAATKMLDRSSGWSARAIFAMWTGRNTGHVLTWNPASGWKIVPNSEGAAPNGIATASGGQLLFFSEFTGKDVVSMKMDGSNRQRIPLDFKPDNLTWTARGTLLAAGATGSLFDVIGCGRVAAGSCQAGFAVAEIEPRNLTAHELLRSDGRAGGGISVAYAQGDSLYLGSFAGDRILRAKLNPPGNG
jgi:hypothetical protein